MKPSPIPVALLVRVSTDRQATARQTADLHSVATERGWTVIEVIEETVTGKANAKDRPGLQRLAALVASGSVRKVLVHEVSRLSRRPAIVHALVEQMEASGVSLYWHAQRIETLMPDGRRNPAAAIMLALLAEMARAETDTLRERINSGLAEARRKGVKLGRKPGSTRPPREILGDHADIIRHLKAGQSIRNTAKLTDKSPSTVLKVRKLVSGGG
jgi:DNA invertase Pin-like site-specific DNA recombinase